MSGTCSVWHSLTDTVYEAVARAVAEKTAREAFIEMERNQDSPP